MARNLDLTALRSFVTVAETGGVTRAAGVLNLTQSAVSMQLKRLEEALGQPLLERQGRGIALTGQGEQLLAYAKRMLALNDEVWARMTSQTFEGEITLGVPHDIVYPHIPHVLQQFARDFPRVKVHLQSSMTRILKEEFAKGQVDVILTTEFSTDAAVTPTGAKMLDRRPLVWVGAPRGQAWRQRPLKLAFENKCLFRQAVQAALNEANIGWDMVVESESSRTIEASVSADLAVHSCVDGSTPPYMEVIPHQGALPDLPHIAVNLYSHKADDDPMVAALCDMISTAYSGEQRIAAQ